ncbi:MAG: DUF2400 family protein [Nitrososphaeria archaeon]|nr:DUF2400 family protein [Nitrososphaeria archaeon]
MNLFRLLLDELYVKFSKSYLSTSMLYAPHYYMKLFGKVDDSELETISFLAAIYDYQMRVPSLLNKFLFLAEELYKRKARFVDLLDRRFWESFRQSFLNQVIYGFFHRFDPRMLGFYWIMKIVYERDLESKLRDSVEYDIALASTIYSELEKYRNIIPADEFKVVKSILPSPEKGSPFKRYNLFLRWIVRDEYPDLGVWKNLDKAKLMVPLGLEIQRVAGRIFYGKDTKASRSESIKITELLKQVNPEDPIKYDFVLSRPALLGWCLKETEYSHCQTCLLRQACKIGSKTETYSRLFDTKLKEPIEAKKPENLIKRHNHLVKIAYQYFIEKYKLHDCRTDVAIDHGLRPDILCYNKTTLVAEIKLTTKTIQGPQQLKTYATELKLKENSMGALVYGKTDPYEIKLIEESIEALELKNNYNKIEIYKYDEEKRTIDPYSR